MAFDIHRCLVKRPADDNPPPAFALTPLFCCGNQSDGLKESSARGTAFMLLREGDTHVSDALEHSVTGSDSPAPRCA